MKTVMCFGTFDLLHLGHLHYFKEAKKYGDYLIVVIARDATKKKQKKKIVFSEKERLELTKHLSLIDESALGYATELFRIIQERKPDVICLGYDQQVDEKVIAQKLASRGLFPVIKRITSYKTKKHKSSLLRKRILGL